MDLTEYLRGEEYGDVIVALADAAKEIRGGFLHRGRAGKTGTVNTSGEEQEAMDVWADGVIEENLRRCGFVSLYASEEREEPIALGGGGFSVVADPLDGSSNIAVNLPVGTIFGVFPGDGVLRPPDEMLAAGYVLYGPLTVMVIAHDGGVDEYVLDGDSFRRLAFGLVIPDGKDFVVSGARTKWLPGYRRYVEACFDSGFKGRNIASMVADFHRALMKGGLYSYPALEGASDGKIRLLFEAGPMSFIAERGGGAGHDGRRRILAKTPSSVHERTPVYVGSRNLADMALEAHAADTDSDKEEM